MVAMPLIQGMFFARSWVVYSTECIAIRDLFSQRFLRAPGSRRSVVIRRPWLINMVGEAVKAGRVVTGSLNPGKVVVPDGMEHIPFLGRQLLQLNDAMLEAPKLLSSCSGRHDLLGGCKETGRKCYRSDLTFDYPDGNGSSVSFWFPSNMPMSPIKHRSDGLRTVPCGSAHGLGTDLPGRIKEKISSSGAVQDMSLALKEFAHAIAIVFSLVQRSQFSTRTTSRTWL
ncbi:hypothetical protein E6O75_ATG05711 [Venturia nashicola]|uniref:Uncharacterized protein n=1 Tax=Venturia nashicola TaxID=86259 RepID=A0A4Z1P8C2_9PEZI|nr:hypothetical protein E6O75_ATG05711 [Venturia nashicola]